MQNSDSRSCYEIESEPHASAEEVVSCARSSESNTEILSELAVLLEKFTPILKDIKNNEQVMDGPPVRTAVESLEKELGRMDDLVKDGSLRPPIKQIEDLTQDLGRSLGLVIFASADVSAEIKEKMRVLYKQLMNSKSDMSLSPSPSPSANPTPRPSSESGFVSEAESEIQIGREIEEERIALGFDDVVLQLKYGNDEEFRLALLGLVDFMRDPIADKECINDEGIIQILCNRLSSSKPSNRLTIIQILRTLALEHTENKEKMADACSLSVLVKSLTRDVHEQSEAVGLLLELSDISAVRRRLGRIQGCIVMLVTILNGDDPDASRDAGKLLTALSGNTQNALHMAEAGYFKPLVQHLKEGSDMSKILMATALSRMELTDQNRASLGEDGVVEPLVKMFKTGKLEAKLSALNALQSLSNSTVNIQRLISSGIVVPLLQLLFSVTSVLMTLREPVSAILAKIAQSESILVNKDVAQQMLSLLNLSSPVIRYHLLQALNSIASHSNASKVRQKMKENCAVQLLLPLLSETNMKIRTAALSLIFTLSKDSPEELTEQLGETNLIIIINIVSSSTSDSEKAAAIGILSNIPISDKKATDILKRSNLLPILISILSSSASTSTSMMSKLTDSIAGVFVRFTVPSDKKLQLHSAESGVIPWLVKLLSTGSSLAKCRAATSLAQLSQNTVALRKSRKSRWMCVPPSADAFCEVHDGYCTVKNTFCLVKAGAISPMIQILEGKERGADEAVLNALATLLQDEICESGSNYMAKMSCVQVIVRLLESWSLKGQEKGLWILERVFRIEENRTKFGAFAQMVLIDLAQNGDPRLRSSVAKVLAQLELIQDQSSYF